MWLVATVIIVLDSCLIYYHISPMVLHNLLFVCIVDGYCYCLLYEEEQIANESSGRQQGVESSVQINRSDGGGLTELEKLLKQKTFTRYALYGIFDLGIGLLNLYLLYAFD